MLLDNPFETVQGMQDRQGLLSGVRIVVWSRDGEVGLLAVVGFALGRHVCWSCRFFVRLKKLAEFRGRRSCSPHLLQPRCAPLRVAAMPPSLLAAPGLRRVQAQFGTADA